VCVPGRKNGKGVDSCWVAGCETIGAAPAEAGRATSSGEECTVQVMGGGILATAYWGNTFVIEDAGCRSRFVVQIRAERVPCYLTKHGCASGLLCAWGDVRTWGLALSVNGTFVRAEGSNGFCG